MGGQVEGFDAPVRHGLSPHHSAGWSGTPQEGKNAKQSQLPPPTPATTLPACSREGEDAKQTQFPRFWAENAGGSGNRSQLGIPSPCGTGSGGDVQDGLLPWASRPRFLGLKARSRPADTEQGGHGISVASRTSG